MPSTSKSIVNEQTAKFAPNSYKEEILQQMRNLLQNDIPLSTAHQIENFIKNVKLRLSGKRPNRTGKKIKVQPTSISRRRPGISRGHCKLPQGRPNSKTNFSFYKRKRYLSSNIRLNQNNPK